MRFNGRPLYSFTIERSVLIDFSHYYVQKCTKLHIQCIQSVNHNVVIQGLNSVVDVFTSPEVVMRVCITTDEEVSSFSPATNHQPVQLPGRYKFDVVI